jgi:hypothetical protein
MKGLIALRTKVRGLIGAMIEREFETAPEGPDCQWQATLRRLAAAGAAGPRRPNRRKWAMPDQAGGLFLSL